MSSQTRNQEYRYQYKTVAIANGFFCGVGPTINVSVPDALLDIKAVYMHAVLKFKPETPVGLRKILWAGADFPWTHNGIDMRPDPASGNMINVDVVADPITRIADLKLDITHLKDILLEAMNNSLGGFDQPFIQMHLLADLGGNNILGDIVLWKIDFAYTTTGIQ